MKDDNNTDIPPINGPEEQHDMQIVEDNKSPATCEHVAVKMAAPRSHVAASMSAEEGWPDVSGLVGLNELSRMAVEVFDVTVADAAKQLLLELVDIWEEVPGALHRIMNENQGVAVGRLRDVTAQQRLSDLQSDIETHAAIALSRRGTARQCYRCKEAFVSAGERAPRVWKSCSRKDVHTMCKGCATQAVVRTLPQCPECVPPNRQHAVVSGGGNYEPFGHIQLLMQQEEEDRRQKEMIAQQLIQEEEAAKRAAEKKKKKKKKKAQNVEETDSPTTAGGGAAASLNDNDADAEDWDADEADHFTCIFTLDIMKEPMFFGDGYSYEKANIESYVTDKLGSEPLTHKTRVRSPKTNEMVPPVMIPNHYLRQAIESWLAHKKKQKAVKEAGAKDVK